MIKSPFPKSIKKIAIIAPAGPPNKALLDKSIQLIKSFGIDVNIRPNVFKSSPFSYLSASVNDRLDDLHQAWEDITVDLILCARGGFGSAHLLNYIDWDLLKSRDIPFIGYSDICALHLAMITMNVKTPISAPMGTNLNSALMHPFTQIHLKEALSPNDLSKIEKARLSILEIKATPTIYTRNNYKFSNNNIYGEVIAVNLTILTSLLGTPFIPTLKDKILFLEDIGEDIYKIDRHLTQLKLSGIIDECLAIVMGDFNGCKPKSELKKLFESFAASTETPLLFNAKFGHIDETLSIVQKRTYRITITL